MPDATTALLVIDLQRGAFDGARCPPVDAPDALICSACMLIEGARAGALPIVFIRHCERETGAAFEEGSVHAELHEALVPAPQDRVLDKHASSAFEGTDLDAWLRGRGIRSLVLCGLQSEFCVSNTARSALALGYRVTLARDGHGTWPSNGRSAAQIEDDANAALAQAGAVLESSQALAHAFAAMDR